MGTIRWLFLILSLLGLRQWLVRIMPQSLVLAVGAGIGLFIAWVPPVSQRSPDANTRNIFLNSFIGLSPNGLGVIGGETVNLVGLGGCKADRKLHVHR